MHTRLEKSAVLWYDKANDEGKRHTKVCFFCVPDKADGNTVSYGIDKGSYHFLYNPGHFCLMCGIHYIKPYIFVIVECL